MTLVKLINKLLYQCDDCGLYFNDRYAGEEHECVCYLRMNEKKRWFINDDETENIN